MNDYLKIFELHIVIKEIIDLVNGIKKLRHI